MEITLNDGESGLFHEKLGSGFVDAENLDFRSESFERSKSRFFEAVKQSEFVVLDVGPGFDPPQISVDQHSNDLWIGVDPALSYDRIGVHKGLLAIDDTAVRLLVPGMADELPEIKADLIMMIAPNPRDIVENGLLVQLEKFITKGTKIYILLDKRTVESNFFGKDARSRVIAFLKTHGFSHDDFEDLKGRKIDTSRSKDAIGGVVFKAKKTR